MRFLRQSTAVDLPIGPFLDASDGITPETALTITQPDIRLKKVGANWAQKNAAQTLSHEENGYYEVSFDTTDTATLGQLRVAVNESGALPVWEDFMVVPAEVYDGLFGAGVVEPAGVFAWPANIGKLAAWLGVMKTNPIQQTSALQTVRNRADSSTLATATVTDASGTTTKGATT